PPMVTGPWRAEGTPGGGVSRVPEVRGSLPVSLFVGLPDGAGDAAAVRDLVAGLARPLTNLRRVVRAAARAGGAPCAASADATRLLRPAAELLAELRGVLLGQIDLVGDSVQSEADGLLGLLAGEIVDELHVRLPCHRGSPSSVWLH